MSSGRGVFDWHCNACRVQLVLNKRNDYKFQNRYSYIDVNVGIRISISKIAALKLYVEPYMKRKVKLSLQKALEAFRVVR
jgi:hypothetical protein